MSLSSLADIQQQEDDIFAQLDSYDYSENELQFSRQPVTSSTRKKALRQLAVSEDSPFNLEPNHQTKLRQLKEEQAAILRKETKEIKDQLDAVKSRLSELKHNQQQPKLDSISKISSSNKRQQEINRTNLSEQKQNSIIVSSAKIKEQQLQPKYRPLTGKADCPNCTCDQRRSSICSQCLILTQPRRASRSTPSSSLKILRQPSILDGRFSPPISSKAASREAKGVATTVDDRIVPNQVYTISKSLNDKRSKLAQAIDELQLMIEQLKEKGNRLEQERKLVQLYKDQWKYGPSIGGPKASSRERLGVPSTQQTRSYESRLDPNLVRDSRSVEGFRSIEPGLKLRQYSRSSSKKPTNTGKQRNLQTRSKSLESLGQAKKSPERAENTAERFDINFREGKSSSQVNLPEVEKVTEEERSERQMVDENDQISLSPEGSVVDCRDSATGEIGTPESQAEKSKESQVGEDDQQKVVETKESRLQRTTWIPVFGETEIKTIKRVPKRKVQIVSPDHNQGRPKTAINGNSWRDKESSSRIRSTSSIRSSNSIQSNQYTQKKSSLSVKKSETFEKLNNIRKIGSNTKVIAEATRKLNAATNLIDQEQQDSVSQNQLIISKSVDRTSQNSASTPINRDTSEENQKDVIKEIARLEELVNEQQRLLTKLNQTQNQEQPRIVSSPITVTCSSPCCHQTAPTTKASAISNRIPLGNKSLINNLRNQLNRSKTRLAKFLELERERHQQLKLKVSSSLRKQSDLENENELLKQSLSKCLDTCLKDISHTFESLSDSLADSLVDQKQQREEADETDTSTNTFSMVMNDTLLTNAAQLISDNRHLKQMKAHIEAIEQQRKGIFEELNKEKQRSNQLELQLKASQAELERIQKEKQAVETDMQTSQDIAGFSTDSNKNPETLPISISSQNVTSQTLDSQPSTSRHEQRIHITTDADTFDISGESCTSVDLYKRYIKSMSPDIETIRQERKLLLSELDNIKNKLFELNTSHE